MPFGFAEMCLQLLAEGLFLQILEVDCMFFDSEVLQVIFAVLLCYFDQFLIFFAFMEGYDLIRWMVASGLSYVIEKFKYRRYEVVDSGVVDLEIVAVNVV